MAADLALRAEDAPRGRADAPDFVRVGRRAWVPRGAARGAQGSSSPAREGRNSEGEKASSRDGAAGLPLMTQTCCCQPHAPPRRSCRAHSARAPCWASRCRRRGARSAACSRRARPASAPTRARARSRPRSCAGALGGSCGVGAGGRPLSTRARDSEALLCSYRTTLLPLPYSQNQPRLCIAAARFLSTYSATPIWDDLCAAFQPAFAAALAAAAAAAATDGAPDAASAAAALAGVPEFGALMAGPVAALSRKPVRVSVAVTRVEAGLELGAALQGLRDYFERLAREFARNAKG
jgi:hypothetical protein